MRQKQRDYFKSRSNTDLRYSKDLERRVDEVNAEEKRLLEEIQAKDQHIAKIK